MIQGFTAFLVWSFFFRASVEAALTKSLPGMAIYGLSIANGAVSMTICPGGVSPSTATTLAGFERTEFSYDKNGNMVAKGHQQHEEKQRGEHHGHDNNHHEGNGWSYTYDFENRLIKAEKKHTIVTYKYDPLGRRIEKRVKEGEHCRHEDEVVHTYVYDGQAIILEYETNGDGRHKKTEATKYVHGPGIDEPLAMTKDNEVYFYHQDGLGSVVALTDKRQKVVEAYEYDSFGNLNGDAKPMQPFTYTGREWDKETGLYYYRARYYDPMDGRCIQRDPIGFKGEDVNLYGYTKNNPINFTDPSGLLSITDIKKWLDQIFDRKKPQLPTACASALNATSYDEADAQCTDCSSKAPRLPGDMTSIGVYRSICIALWCEKHPDACECGKK